MRELSLFTGVGGGLLGTHHLLGWETVGAVEWEKYPCKVLAERQKEGLLDEFPIWNMDIREFNRRIAPMYQGVVDVITAGFPCQPFSVAGKRKGADDERNMWPATWDAIRIIRPAYCLLENVPALLTSGYFETVIGGLTEIGYDARWDIISAADVGAPHLRKRLWVVARSRDVAESEGVRWRVGASKNIKQVCGQGDALSDGGSLLANPKGAEPRKSSEWERWSGVGGGGKEVPNSGDEGLSRAGCGNESNGEKSFARNSDTEVPNSNIPRLEGQWDRTSRSGAEIPEPTGDCGTSWWDTDPSEGDEPEPELGRVAYGIPDRVDRLKGIGNAQVPAVAATAWSTLTTEVSYVECK